MSRRNVELLLLCISAPLVVVLFAMLAIQTGEGVDFNTLGVPVGIFCAFLIAHFAIRKLAPVADPALLPIAFALSGIGIAFVTRLAPEAAARQLVWMFAGVAALIVVLLVVRNIEKLSQYKYTLILVGVLLLLSPMLPGIGTEINGSRLWLTIGPFSFQPGELAKICIALFLAAYLSQNREMLSVFTWRIGPLRLPSIQTLLPLLAMWALAFLIVVLEKDLGSALVLFLMFLVMLYVSTGKKSYIVIGTILAAIAAVALYYMFSHVQTRVQIWLDPFGDAQGSGYQIVQGLFSMADGGMFGVGIGRGMSDVIPYVESDFIFAAIAEETGLLGAAALLLLYLCFAIRGIFTAARAKSDFSSFLSAGITSIVILQAFIIVGGVTKLIPLTGITLPFVSQGGSSLLAGFLIVGLLLRASDAGTGQQTEMATINMPAVGEAGAKGAGRHSAPVMAKGPRAKAGGSSLRASRGAHSSSYVSDSENSTLGRVALGKRLTNTMIAFSVLFALLVANLTYIMVIQADELRGMPGNGHVIAREATSERGTISTYDGVVLAKSVEQPNGTYKREYPSGDLASHVVGYYSSKYGTSGIEASMNETLKGSENYGSLMDVINSMAGITTPGNDVTLTLNSRVQQAAQEAISGFKGACVVMDPTTGAILGMASSPTYDAANAEGTLEAAASNSTDSSELLNRAIQTLYSPGSTFKAVTVTTALEDGVVQESTVFPSPGTMDIGNAPVSNVKDRSYGDITVAHAFQVSSNTVFGQIGVLLGATRLVDGADAFGFGKKIDCDLPVTTSLMPDPDEMTTWETAWAAAGEPVGEHASPAGPQATVLQMALVGAGIANGGVIMDPYLVEGVYSANGTKGFSATPKKLFQATSSATADRVLELMRGVVSAGTATDAALPGVTVAGKTGTAEHEGKPSDSWFIGIADADGAKNVVVALMVEQVGDSAHAAGLSRDVIATALEVQGVG